MFRYTYYYFGCTMFFCDFCKGQRIFGSPVAKQYTVASFLANCHCCLYGDEHTAHFNCRAPTLEEYLE